MDELLQRIERLEKMLLISDKYLFQKPLIGGPNGLRLGSMAKDKIGVYATAPVAQYSTHFNTSAGGTYGSTEQNMLNGMQSALLSYGWIVS